MGIHVRPRDASTEQVIDSPTLGGGQWYRIAQYAQPSNRESQASAEFILADGNPDRNDFIRLRASVAYGDDNSSLLLEEYACWSLPSLTLARIVEAKLADGIDGYALEIWGNHEATAIMRLRIRHEEFWSGVRWQPVAFTPVDPAQIIWEIMVRGLGPTGEFEPPPLENGWTEYGDVFTPPGYRMRPGSLVQLRGLVKGGTVHPSNGVIFRLPVGYRPLYQMIFPVIVAGNTVGRVDIGRGGEVIAVAGGNGFFSLDSISFLAQA